MRPPRVELVGDRLLRRQTATPCSAQRLVEGFTELFPLRRRGRRRDNRAAVSVSQADRLAPGG
jgi:hypothetical protein